MEVSCCRISETPMRAEPGGRYSTPWALFWPFGWLFISFKEELKTGELASSTGWWITVLLSAFAGLILVRTFIIFHDCGHGSFLKSKRRTTHSASLRVCLPSPPTITGNGNIPFTMPARVISPAVEWETFGL